MHILTYALTGGNEFFLKGEEGGDYVELFINDESVGKTYVWWDKDMEQEVGGDCRYIVINNEMFHLRDMFERGEVSAETFNAPATKKPKLTKTQLEALNMMKASTFSEAEDMLMWR